jgi:hypothetical protein
MSTMDPRPVFESSRPIKGKFVDGRKKDIEVERLSLSQSGVLL